MDLKFLLNPAPKQIPKPTPTTIPVERGQAAPVLLARLEQEPTADTQAASMKPTTRRSIMPPRPARVPKSTAEWTGEHFADVRKCMKDSYTREFKVKVLQWWYHYQLP
ncbi:hypothetical protein L873DRAFT_1789924 [Choiromyces venosus 120613-1]|uniref:Uncharacterized protein n=1 Tax=Choiromyces venosus 120613-1 TaxID=1336337 RepID=A0A3N4JPR2_9PEZI|nr:hypothetical protein L873DRAFT_1789924 [Choiromyces venosus 120613-1]